MIRGLINGGVNLAYNFNYPVMLNLTGKTVLVAGGGKVATRKVLSLLKAGALVTVVSPVIDPAISKESSGKYSSALHLLERGWQKDDCKNMHLVIAATNNSELNRKIALEAKENHSLVNVIDDPDFGNFSVAGSYQTGQLTFTVSTGGNPRLTHLLLKDIATQYGPDLTAFTSYLDEKRQELKDIPELTPDMRQKFWRKYLTQENLTLVKEGRLQQVKEIIDNAITSIRFKS